MHRAFRELQRRSWQEQVRRVRNWKGSVQDAMRRMAPSLPRHSSFKPPLSQRRLRVSVAFLGVLALGGCSGGVLDPKGPIGATDSLIMINSLEIMLAIVIPTITAALLMAWWYRSSNRRAFYRPDWAYSGRLELIVWSIPVNMDPARCLDA